MEDGTEAPQKRRHRAAWIAAGVGVTAALLVGVLATSDPAGTRAADSPLVGKQAPAFDTTTIDGGRFELTQYRGRWVLVNFFATWCVPCLQEHPELIRLHREHQLAGDAEVVGVVYDDSVSAVRDFREREGGLWPMLTDPKGRIALDFGVAGVPESYIIDPEGRVAAKVVGQIRAGPVNEILARLQATRPPA